MADEPLTLMQFLASEHEFVRRFGLYWSVMRKQRPDDFPEKLPIGDWDEQLRIFEPGWLEEENLAGNDDQNPAISIAPDEGKRARAWLADGIDDLINARTHVRGTELVPEIQNLIDAAERLKARISDLGAGT